MTKKKSLLTHPNAPKSTQVTQKCPKMAVVLRNSRLLVGICARVAARQSKAVVVPVKLPKRGFEWRQTFHCSGVAPTPPLPAPQMRLPEAKKMQLQYTCKVGVDQGPKNT